VSDLLATLVATVAGWMTAVADWVLDLPLAVAALCLTIVAASRSQATYWLGRGIRAGVLRAPWARRLAVESSARATRWLDRWGWPIVPLSFLTVGFQSAVQLTAGLIGWRWRRYSLAAMPGWIAWGWIYAAVGLAAFRGLIELARRSPWLAIAVAAVLVGGIGLGMVLSRLRAARARAPEAVGAVEPV
jgi:membrane protein DedA with SNARE-associated domain